MSKQNQKRIIQINHALSGVVGQQLKTIAFRVNDIRKQTLKKLERKKKLSSVLYDQLYEYLQKFPQQRMGLRQQPYKKKKGRGFELQDRIAYKSPIKSDRDLRILTKQDPITEMKKLNGVFQDREFLDDLQQQLRNATDE